MQIINKSDMVGHPAAERIYNEWIPKCRASIWGLRSEDHGAAFGHIVARPCQLIEFGVDGFEWVKRAEMIERKTDPDAPSFLRATGPWED